MTIKLKKNAHSKFRQNRNAGSGDICIYFLTKYEAYTEYFFNSGQSFKSGTLDSKLRTSWLLLS